jgi:hypothetical protein
MSTKEEIDKLNNVNVEIGEKRKLMEVRDHKRICVRMYCTHGVEMLACTPRDFLTHPSPQTHTHVCSR